ncbi:MAG: polyphosphate kinase 1 [Bacteroidales bacterium]|nr:polyphosphate kinase 1 [Bacteroidales bacterium]
MLTNVKYFNRDISWLAFNRRVLEEAKDETLTIAESMRFLSIYSLNLVEFYNVRVAEYRNAVEGNQEMKEVANPQAALAKINHIVSEQICELSNILSLICNRLEKHGVTLYNGVLPSNPEHLMFMHDYFFSEVIPYLQPVIISRDTRVFLRDNRPYFALKLYKKHKHKTSTKPSTKPTYALVKLPFTDLKRFVELPQIEDGHHHMVFLDDIIRINIGDIFPGYEIDGIWCIKVERDADLGIDDDFSGDIVQKIKQNLGRRKIGAPSSFYIDRTIAPDLLKALEKTFNFNDSEIVKANRYFNLHQFDQFPIAIIDEKTADTPQPIHPKYLPMSESLFAQIKRSDRILHYPYQSFDYVIRLLNEAAIDPKVEEIKVTQYRVATNSAVVNSLIAAAHNNKKVTVFVELKARFDEENNIKLAERMKESGIKVIYSIPGLKVHAKMALIIRREGSVRKSCYAYLSTGNFNEKTARQYTDHGLFTRDEGIINDLERVFQFLEDQSKTPKLEKLLLTRINLKPRLIEMIDREIANAEKGLGGCIILKMNGLQNREIINKLYEASMAGVKIHLIIRSVCCLVPDQPYSRNITITRIVDRFLEHGRIWFFSNCGKNEIYLTSSDLLNRNLYHRIECAFPIENEEIKKQLIDILTLQMSDNVKARRIDCFLNDHMIDRNGKEIRAQKEIYKILADL